MSEQKEIPEAVRSMLQEFIGSRRWKYAYTYRRFAPHWYTVREWEPEKEAEFEKVVRAIRKYGYDRPWRRRTFRSLDFEGVTYWTMGAPVEETTVINRVPTELKNRGSNGRWITTAHLNGNHISRKRRR